VDEGPSEFFVQAHITEAAHRAVKALHSAAIATHSDWASLNAATRALSAVSFAGAVT
jgi:hypothetical protein